MRRSGWLLAIPVLWLWLFAVAYPAFAAIAALVQPATDLQAVEGRPAWHLLVTSVGWAALVAFGAILIGWVPGRVLGRSIHRGGFVSLAALVLVPVCLPAYVVFYAWWQSWPADSALHEWVVRHGHMQTGRHVTLYLGLVCWSWPLAALAVAGSASRTSAQREELLLLDGATWRYRLADRLRSDGSGLALGGLFVFLATLNNTTCFDLAEVFTFANELRALEALGTGPFQTLVAGLPALAIAVIGAIAVWMLLGWRWRAHEAVERVSGARTSSIVTTAVIWLVSAMVPLVLFAQTIAAKSRRGVVGEFFDLYGASLLTTVMLAAISGGLAALIAIGMAALWQDHRRAVRWTAHAIAMIWLVAGLVPGTITGVALEAAYNRTSIFDEPYQRLFGLTSRDLLLPDLVYQQPVILVLAHLASFGFIAVLFGRWMASSEARTLRDLRRLDGAQTLRGIITTTWPMLLAAAAASFAIVTVLAIGEVPVTAQVNPPHRAGAGPLALSLLNDMHYQRPQTVMIAALAMTGGAAIAALALAAVWKTSKRLDVQTSKDEPQRFGQSSRGAAARRSLWTFGRLDVLTFPLAFCLLLSGCVPDDPDNVAPLDPELIFGSPGQSLGQFGYPRALDVDPQREAVYVIDKTARVQRFGFDGKPQLEWHMPAMENGKPTGVSVGPAPAGNVYVADTHYFRVMVYSPEGKELFQFGEYGRGPGQFIYTTDIAFGPDGKLYVSEYGGNDRVQVFDAKGSYLFQFGSFGSGPGEFNRPQSLAFSSDGSELFIADACNHRIVVTDPKGNVLRTFGSAGRNPGQFAYPYSVEVLDDGSLLVSEFGSNRIQRLDAQGKCLGLYGRIGRQRGELQYPWATAAAGEKVFVLDSGNNRVQVVEF